MRTMNDLFAAMHNEAVKNRQANGVMLDAKKNNTPGGIGQGILNVRK